MQIPRRKAEERRPIVHDDPYLTSEAIKRMEEELEHLTKHSRKTAAEEVARTGAMGDFSENAAYQTAKGRLRGINSRILVIQDRLKHAIEIKGQASDKIGIGSRVTLKVGPAERIYEIVGSQEADPSAGRVSRTSPLGAALLGTSVGDEVTVKTPRGETSYKVLKVE